MQTQETINSSVLLHSNPWQIRPADRAAAALDSTIDNFKRLLVKADRQALKNDSVVPAALVTDIENAFNAFTASMHAVLDQGLTEREEFGALMQTELLPYLLLADFAERSYSKPRGYAGDFLTIDQIYKNRPGGRSRLGPVLDQCFLNLPAAKAVRNRRGLLAEEIDAVIAGKDGPAKITSLACGPAAEVFDVFARLEDPASVFANLIDIDFQALAFVGEQRDKARLKSQIRLINANLAHLATGRARLDLPQQDLVYSIGLIDYFEDKFVVKLLNYIHASLVPGGKVILGNFHPRNSSRAIMDHVLDWRLIHRTEDDMDRLFATSSFARSCTRIRFEDQGINMFAECIK